MTLFHWVHSVLRAPVSTAYPLPILPREVDLCVIFIILKVTNALPLDTLTFVDGVDLGYLTDDLKLFLGKLLFLAIPMFNVI